MVPLPSLIFLFVTFQTVISLTEVDRTCINTYSDDLDNDFLIGTWYDVYKFAHFLNLLPSRDCVNTTITKPSSSEVQKYIDAYRLENPYSFNDNPVLMDRRAARGIFKGMLMGHKQTKFHVFEPESYYFREDEYEARVYRKINNDYMLYHQCFLRGSTKWLMSRKRNVTNEELDEVIKSIHSEIGRHQTQRFCA